MTAAACAERADCVGPNAVLQLRAVLDARFGPAETRRVFRAASAEDYLARPPEAPVPQARAAALFRETRAALGAEDGDAALAEAGARTGDYVALNRVPAAAKTFMRLAPSWASGRLLMLSMRGAAWTFGGSAPCTLSLGARCSLSLRNNPLAIPGCPWQIAAFQRLFEALLPAPVDIVHRTCCARGDRECLYEFHWPAAAAHGAEPARAQRLSESS